MSVELVGTNREGFTVLDKIYESLMSWNEPFSP